MIFGEKLFTQRYIIFINSGMVLIPFMKKALQI
jgi:hypothetical protein